MWHRKEAVWGHGEKVSSPSQGQRPPQDPPCQHLDPGLPACRTVGQRVLVDEAPPHSVTFWKGGLAHRMSWWGTPGGRDLALARW